VKRVLGVAYTEYLSDPRVRRESEALAQRGDQVTVLCLQEANRPEREMVEGVHVQLFSDAELRQLDLEPVRLDNLPAVDAVVLNSFHAEYANFDFTDFPWCRVLVDGPGALDAHAVEAAGIRYMRVGLGTADRLSQGPPMAALRFRAG